MSLTLILEDEGEEDFSLIGIHCREEPYKVAFLLNRALGTSFKRLESDLDFTRAGKKLHFGIYEWHDKDHNLRYHLIVNCARLLTKDDADDLSEGLFAEKIYTHYFLPEFKKVDFFIKLNREGSYIDLEPILKEIKNIKQVVSAYEIAPGDIKCINNLIVD